MYTCGACKSTAYPKYQQNLNPKHFYSRIPLLLQTHERANLYEYILWNQKEVYEFQAYCYKLLRWKFSTSFKGPKIGYSCQLQNP